MTSKPNDSKHVVIENLHHENQHLLDDISEMTQDFDNDKRLSYYVFKVFVYGILVTAILFSPAAYFLNLDLRYAPNLLIYDLDQLSTQLGVFHQLVRWSIYLTGSWLTMIMVFGILGQIPMVFVTCITMLRGDCSERWRELLAYVPVVRKSLTFMITMILSVVYFAILFVQYPLVVYWQQVYQLLLVIMVASILLFIQKLVIHMIAVNFHKIAYKDRIQESTEATEILQCLKKSVKQFGLTHIFDHDNTSSKKSSPTDNLEVVIEERTPPKRSILGFASKKSSVGAAKDTKNPLGEPALLGSLEKLNQPDVCVKNDAHQDVFDTETKVNVKLSRTIFSMDAIRIGASGFSNALKSVNLLSDRHAINLSKRLFQALTVDNNPIAIESFLPYFPSKAEAKKAFTYFDLDDSGSITKREFKHSMLKIYRERRNLLKSLRDLSQALGILNRLVYGIVFCTTAFCALPIYGISISTILPFASLVLALSFVFGGSAKSTFESILFVFIAHPFDTGDKIAYDNQTYQVEEINLLTTVLKRSDGQKSYVPNSILANKEIGNIRRSGDQGEMIYLHVPFKTKQSLLDELGKRIQAFVESQPKDYNSPISLNVSEITPGGLVKLGIFLNYKGNWQDSVRKSKRKTAFLFKLIEAGQDLGIDMQFVEVVNVKM
ncbi:hypothetical protein HDV02_001611 [Globomyces sp. JEL0801]|nr:hypothetical protein HDV02_001611 [Globomyces sp. JEL0801]